MPVFAKELDAPIVEEPVVRVRVTARGHGKISTGRHDGRDGEEFYAEGDEFEVAESIAKELASDKKQPNAAGEIRMFVTIIKTPTKG